MQRLPGQLWRVLASCLHSGPYVRAHVCAYACVRTTGLPPCSSGAATITSHPETHFIMLQSRIFHQSHQKKPSFQYDITKTVHAAGIRLLILRGSTVPRGKHRCFRNKAWLSAWPTWRFPSGLGACCAVWAWRCCRTQPRPWRLQRRGTWGPEATPTWLQFVFLFLAL